MRQKLSDIQLIGILLSKFIKIIRFQRVLLSNQ